MVITISTMIVTIIRIITDNLIKNRNTKLLLLLSLSKEFHFFFFFFFVILTDENLINLNFDLKIHMISILVISSI